MNRFIRLDTMWDASRWLAPLSSECRLCWVLLLCYVKAHGRDGRAKALDPARAARMWYVGEESVRQLFLAAESHGAVHVEGSDWVVDKWSEYQGDSTANERMKRYRERKSESESVVVTAVTRNARNVTRERDRERDREETDKYPPLPPKGDFDAFWSEYPRRKGSNPKQPARVSYERSLRTATHEEIMRGLAAYKQSDPGERGAEFIAQAATWLNQRRWEDDYSVVDERAKILAQLGGEA